MVPLVSYGFQTMAIKTLLQMAKAMDGENVMHFRTISLKYQ
jgi:hypothetical protein